MLSTDAKFKNDKYTHLGLRQVGIRQLDEKSFMYDLVKYSDLEKLDK